MEPARDETAILTPPVWRPRAKFQDRVWLQVLLFILTVATTTYYGALHYEAFRADFSERAVALSRGALLLRGLWYSVTVLAILGCHELGHYLACRYYDVDASRPYFLPVPPPLVVLYGIPIPPPVMTGLLGAFIRIREPIPQKRMLFDIGIAGPIAGFLVAVPALFVGISMSHVVRIPAGFTGYELGEPLVFKLASWMLWGKIPDGYSLNMHPMAFAAWFGLLATALNLFPAGQLDGGHISYAVLGRKSSYVTLTVVAAAILLTFSSASWFMWTFLMIVMLFIFGPHHPRVFDEEVRLDRTRLWLALFALAMFVLCFTPVPIQLIDLIRH